MISDLSILNYTPGTLTLERPLARGRMAALYLTHDGRRPLVLKVATPEVEGDLPERRADMLRREVGVLRALRHPGIVRIFPLRTGDYIGRMPSGLWYFVMEYVPGGTLEDHRVLWNDFALDWRLELFYQVLIIVDNLHRRGIAHGDLKPENILLRDLPDPERPASPVLADFGTASSALEMEAVPGATLHYSAPERLVTMRALPDLEPHRALLPWSLDMFALGALLYELVGGSLLYPQPTLEEEVHAMLIASVPLLPVPDDLNLLIRALVDPDPSQRPRAHEVIEWLERL